MRTLLSTSIALVLLTSVYAQRDAKIPDPDPEIERRTFKVAEGFEVNLFAADPQLAKPIHMNFDAAGRLWIASSEVYPQIKPGQKANDRILVLEDTKGQGKADRVTVFADGLLIPTGIEPGDGGAYVANSTDLIHLSDTDGDGKADRRRIVLSGFGTEDTHHILHTLRWGHDGNLYMNQSVYIHSHIETPYGPRRLGGGGIWQFRPDTQRLEVYVRGFWNSWGHHFDRFGQSFITDGAGFQGVAYGFPGAAYEPSPGVTRFLKGMNFGSPKYCGLEIVSGRHLPDDWQGNLITCDFRAHRVCRFVLAPSGSGYTARLMPDVIRATHPAFRPVDVKMGPDGAIYVADWYNPIIQHGEVDFRDPRRDQTRGRIWRITAKGRPLVQRPALVKASIEELVEQLRSPEGWTRHFARRVLAERKADAVRPVLDAWVAKHPASNPDNEPHLLEALWTYQTLDIVEPKLLRMLLTARDGRVRAAAVRVTGAWHDRLEGVLALLEPRVADEHPQVRLEAVRALALLNSVRAAEVALRVLDRPLDEYLDYALWLTVRELESAWLPALQAGKLDLGGSTARLTFALQAVGSDKVVGPVAELVRGGRIQGEAAEEALKLLAGVGGPGELALVLQQAAKASTASRVRLFAALEEAARQRGVLAPQASNVLLPLLAEGDESSRVAAIRLAGVYRLAEARPALVQYVEDGKTALAIRQTALEALAGLGGADSVRLLSQTAGDSKNVLQRPALIALAGLDLSAAAKLAPRVLAGSADATGAAEVFLAFLQRKGGADLLSKALQGQKLPADVARIGVRTVRGLPRPAPGLVETLNQAGGLNVSRRELSAEEVRSLLADVSRQGDPARGEAIYRRADQLCLKCHAIGGAGGQVGPDLSSIGASAPLDYLLESLLQPSKAIKENYHATLVTTIKGQQFTGIKVRQTPTALVLRNDQDREITIPIKDIEEQGASTVSLMPEGLSDPLTRGELIDLVRFLSELGKSERYSVGNRKVARRWQVLQPTREVYHQLGRLGLGSFASERPGLTWDPAYSTVAGLLPLSDLPRFQMGKDGPPQSVLRVQLEATSPTTVQLLVGSTKGLSAWLDGEPVTLQEKTALRLAAGARTLTLAVDHRQRDEALRLEIEDEPASAGVRFVGGK